MTDLMDFARQDLSHFAHHDLEDTMTANEHFPPHPSFPPVSDMELFGISHNQFSQNDIIDMNPSLFNNTAGLASETATMASNGCAANFNPASMWLGGLSSGPLGSQDVSGAYSTEVPRALTSRVQGSLGQITPPDDDVSLDNDQPSPKTSTQTRKDVTKRRRSSSSAPSKRQRKDSKVSMVDKTDVGVDQMEEDEEEDDGILYASGDRREKYREKNRVAAAKCRAKKKKHTDSLEDDFRTQSVLHQALKQAAQSLRDELSWCRTQALQHTYCNCQAIQDYNMHKARNLAAESIRDRPEQEQRHYKSAGSASSRLASPVSSITRSSRTNAQSESMSKSPPVAQSPESMAPAMSSKMVPTKYRDGGAGSLSLLARRQSRGSTIHSPGPAAGRNSNMNGMRVRAEPDLKFRVPRAE